MEVRANSKTRSQRIISNLVTVLNVIDVTSIADASRGIHHDLSARAIWASSCHQTCELIHESKVEIDHKQSQLIVGRGGGYHFLYTVENSSSSEP